MSRLLNSQKFYATDEASTANPIGKDGILDILNSDDEPADEINLDEKPKKDEKVKIDEPEPDPIEKEDDEKDELEELESELTEPELDEDELEILPPVKRKEILAKYPNFFKDFPQVEKAYYREQKYSELLPTLEDARVAKEKAETLDNFEKRILTGDLSNILSVVKNENAEAFKSMVDNMLPNLQKIDSDAFIHVANSILKPVIYNMYTTGQQNQDEQLMAAATAMNKYIYNSTKWEPHSPLAKSNGNENVEAQKLQAERQELFNERYTHARTELGERVERTFKSAIEKHIDPKSDMSEYTRKNAVREAHEVLSEHLSKDSRLRNVLDKAWKKAGEQNFSKDSMDNIRKIINARAQSVLPTVIKKARNEALRGMGKRVREDNNTDSKEGRSTSSSNRGPLKQPTSRSSSNNKMEIPKGMSNKDFLMSD